MPAVPQTTAHTTHVPAGLGIDEGTRAELVAFGQKNLAVTNCRQDQLGDLDARNGFAALPTTHIDATTPTAGYKLIADERAPVRLCDGSAETYDAKSATWRVIGRVPDCTASLIDLPGVSSAPIVEDQESANGYIVTVWRTSTAGTTYAYASLINATTGAAIRAPEFVVGSAFLNNPTIASYGTVFILIVCEVSAGDMTAFYLDTASAATISAGWISMGTLAAATHALAFSRDSACSLPDRVAFAYPNQAGIGTTTQMTVRTLNKAGLIDTAVLTTATGVLSTVDVAYSATDNLLWASHLRTLDVYVQGLAASGLATTVAAGLLMSLASTAVSLASTIGIAASSVSGKGRVIVSTANGLGMSRVDMRSFQTTGAAVVADGAAATAWNAQAAGKPFQYGARYFVPVFGDGVANNQSVCILADFTDAVSSLRPVANVSPGLVKMLGSHKGKCVAGATASQMTFGIAITRSGVADASALAVFDFADSARWGSVSYGGMVMLSGGVLSYSDRTRIPEVGFLLRPSTPLATTSGTGITAVTGWRYVCVYEDVDGNGNWSVSGLSSPSVSTGAVTNKTITVTTAPLSISARVGNATVQSTSVRVAFYRTLDGGVAPYYRLGTTPNDPSAAAISFTDAISDATLAANAKLYSQPGVPGTAQDRRAPPFFSCITTYNGVLVGASGSDVWYSGQNVSGEGAWFNPVFQIPVPGDGDITALWVMDGTLFVAKRREIYAITGEAPSDNGATGGLGLPRRLAVDVGCIEPRSVCVTTLGAFFQSDRGIEILTRAQTVAWIGQPMQETLALFPVITSVTVEPVACVVYFELAAAQSAGLVTGNGRTLVFDLSLKDWVSTDRRTSAAGAADAPSQSACMIYTGSAYRYAWLTSAGVVHYEDPTTHLDANGSFIAPSYETAWLKHGLQQEQRVWAGTILFQQNTAAGLKIECAYDYGAYVLADTKPWTEAETLGRRQLEWRPKPRGAAMKFRVTATAPAVLGTGQAFTFIGMSFDLAPKQGATKGVVRLDPTVRK